jgi:tetratricopeptide (TPR) repeat protein
VFAGVCWGLGSLAAAEDTGRPAKVLTDIAEAVTKNRQLAVTNPGRYRPYLAHSLTNLGTRFAELGRPAEALPALREAVEMYRELAAANPDRFRPALARALLNLTYVRKRLGETP